jgi:hypothetical protein
MEWWRSLCVRLMKYKPNASIKSEIKLCVSAYVGSSREANKSRLAIDRVHTV